MVSIADDTLKKTKACSVELAKVIQNGGGRFRQHGTEGAMFNVYNNVNISSLVSIDVSKSSSANGYTPTEVLYRKERWPSTGIKNDASARNTSRGVFIVEEHTSSFWANCLLGLPPELENCSAVHAC